MALIIQLTEHLSALIYAQRQQMEVHALKPLKINVLGNQEVIQKKQGDQCCQPLIFDVLGVDKSSFLFAGFSHYNTVNYTAAFPSDLVINFADKD